MTLKVKTLLILSLTSLFILVAGLSGWYHLDRKHNHAVSLSEVDLAALNIANDFGLMAARLESLYMRGKDSADIEFSAQKHKDHFNDKLEELRELTSQSSRFNAEKKSVLDQLEGTVSQFLHVCDSAESVKIEHKVSKQSEQLFSAIDQMVIVFEESISQGNNQSIKELKRAKLFFGLLFLVAIILHLVVYQFVVGQIITPIQLLTESLQRIQNREFHGSLLVESNDELGQLMRSFNNMSAELRVMQLQNDNEKKRLMDERSALVEGFPHPIMIFDQKGNVTQMNTEAKAVLGDLDSAAQMDGKLGEVVEQVLESNENYIPQGLEDSILKRVQNKERWFWPRLFKINSHKNNNFDGWAAIFADVTQIRWVDNIKADLLGTVCHEIKTPMTSIQMMLHLLEERKFGDLNEKQVEMLTSAIMEADKLTTTVNSLLGISKMRSVQDFLDEEEKR